MKNFKRKLARLFGLALRSDLEYSAECYKRRDKEAIHYYTMLTSHPDFNKIINN